jgi:hypothetical protein
MQHKDGTPPPQRRRDLLEQSNPLSRRHNLMFVHDKRLQYNARPSKPDPVYAKQLQEVLGGQFGEMSVMMQYLFQGWNCRGPQKYRICCSTLAPKRSPTSRCWRP